MLFHKEKNILVIATKFSTAGNLVKKVKAIMKALPPWLQVAKVLVDNRTSFELTNGSTIKAASTSGDAGRSEALSLLVIDEAAHIDGLSDLWTGLYPTLSTGGRCIALSTPNGVGNWFHKTFAASELGDNDFHPVVLPWEVHPERDQAWFEKETKNMSRRQIAQELECNFNTSGDTVIHPDDLAWLNSCSKEPIYRVGFDRNFWLWEKYQEGSTYLMVADVARGDGTDFSVFHIIKLETMEVVAEYQGKPTLDMYSKILFDAASEFGTCLLVVENNGIGISVIEKLIDLNYPNLYYSIKSTHEFVDSVHGEHSGKPQAMRSYNDDLVMSLAIACFVRDTALEVNKRDVEYQKAILDSMYIRGKELNTAIPGMGEHQRNQKFEKKYEKEIQQAKELVWLFKG